MGVGFAVRCAKPVVVMQPRPLRSGTSSHQLGSVHKWQRAKKQRKTASESIPWPSRAAKSLYYHLSTTVIDSAGRRLKYVEKSPDRVKLKFGNKSGSQSHR